MLKSEIGMKRDMDLIRAILLACEVDEHGFAPRIEIEGYTQEQIGYHAVLLGEAGLAKVNNVTTMGSPSPRAQIVSLTWEGHEFLDSARDNQIWNLAKDSINKLGGASIQVWVIVLTGLIKKHLGI